MNRPAAIQAEFVDTKRIKTRSVLQLIFECPIELEPHIMATLGWPKPETSLPVAVARLTIEAMRATMADDVGTPEKPATKRHFRDLKRAAQAAMKCQDDDFCSWLFTGYADKFPSANLPDALLKRALGITSKAELDSNEDAGRRWDALLTEFSVKDYQR